MSRRFPVGPCSRHQPPTPRAYGCGGPTQNAYSTNSEREQREPGEARRRGELLRRHKVLEWPQVPNRTVVVLPCTLGVPCHTEQDQRDWHGEAPCSYPGHLTHLRQLSRPGSHGACWGRARLLPSISLRSHVAAECEQVPSLLGRTETDKEPCCLQRAAQIDPVLLRRRLRQCACVRVPTRRGGRCLENAELPHREQDAASSPAPGTRHCRFPSTLWRLQARGRRAILVWRNCCRERERERESKSYLDRARRRRGPPMGPRSGEHAPKTRHTISGTCTLSCTWAKPAITSATSGACESSAMRSSASSMPQARCTSESVMRCGWRCWAHGRMALLKEARVSPSSAPARLSRRSGRSLKLGPETRRREDSGSAELSDSDDLPVPGDHDRAASRNGAFKNPIVGFVVEDGDPHLGSDHGAVTANVLRDAPCFVRGKAKRTPLVHQDGSQLAKQHLTGVAAQRAGTHSQPDAV